MVKVNKFTYKTEDDSKLFACCWYADSNKRTKGVIQIAHGMAEHILRYDPFAKFLVQQGFIVYGHDHRGHGQNIVSKEDTGFFIEQDGFAQVVRDMRALTEVIKENHPNLPLVLFGHSMGSFIVRRYIQLYGEDIHAVILSGTGRDKGLIGKIGLQIAKREVRKKGARTPSPLMDKLIFGNFNRQFKPNRTKFDFLTREQSTVDDYMNDAHCGFICSAQFYVDLLSGIELIHRTEEIKKTPKDLPILLISGDQDPVGDNGKGVRSVYNQYKRAGISNITLKLYTGARHEILNETNKADVYEYILQWLKETVKGESKWQKQTFIK